MKAIGYVRVSHGSQVESGLGLEAQESAIKAAAQRMNVELVAIHRDEGLSGALGLEDRPGLVAALDALQPEWLLLIGKRDRLGRDSVAVAMIESLVERKGAKVVSALEEGANGDDPSNVLMRRLLDAFAEFERLLISSRVKASLREKRLVRGEIMGNPPFGYRIKDGKLVPEKREQKIIEAIAILREQHGRSVPQIARELRAHGVQSRRGTPLGIGQIWAIVKKLKRKELAP